MDLVEKLFQAIPELKDEDFLPLNGSIIVSDDGDGIQYISKWEYNQPLPEGFVLGKIEG